ncbi:LOW QUALITY PROTEIN: hypothetical protein Cgig2_024078 [Carnegiea gigantea]|uniref:Uncharacterized protein n=1 Tax=Carnegiea gigantea TaxID=171969 RepID=A0A9Q1QDJ3_9CARY|nr:LOW QUALITY PROTEIN: hypothetical protein Cgig2_024078 [Carnegiea gigantea]
MTRSAWKAQLRGTQQVLTTEQGARVTVPTMVFGEQEAPRFTSPHNDPLLVEMKIASAIVRRILIDTGSSVDIITWDFLKKLTYPGLDIIPLVHPILGFGEQESKYSLKKRRRRRKRKRGVTYWAFHYPHGPYLRESRAQHPGGWSPHPLGHHPHRTGDKLHLLGIPTLGLGLQAFIDMMEVGLERPPRILEPTSPRPCIDTPMCSHGLIDNFTPSPAVTSASALESASSSWCCRSFFSPFRVSFSSFSFSQRRWYRVTSPSSLLRSTVAFTPQAKASAIVTSSSVTLWGSEVPEETKSCDLTKVGPDEVRRRLTGTRGSTTGISHGLRGAKGFSEAGGSVSSRPASHTMRRGGLIVPHIPAWIGTEAAVSSGRPSKALSFFFLMALGFGRHLFGGGVPGLENHQFRPCLLCKEQKGFRSEPSKKADQNRSGKPAAARKQMFPKNFNLGSQFKGSLSLDLLFLFLGPFTDSIA